MDTTSTRASVQVHNLLCHRHVGIASRCLGSLLAYSEQPIALVLHDDGSLTADDVETLQTNLPGARVVRRAEADERMNALLSQYPHARQYRYEHPLALKLLDIPAFSDTHIIYCDSDVLFMKPVSQFFSLPDSRTAALFMADGASSYSVRPWHLTGHDKISLPKKINTGLMVIQKSAYDLDFVEWFLSKGQGYRYVASWAEQTCYAALGKRIGYQLWDSSMVAVVNRPELLTQDLVAGHFVGTRRDLIDQVKPITATESITPVQVPIRPAIADCTPQELAVTHLRRTLRLAPTQITEAIRRSPIANMKRAMQQQFSRT